MTADPIEPGRPTPHGPPISAGEEQLANALRSAIGDVIQSLGQVVGNPPLADNGQYLRYLADAIKALHESSKKAAGIGNS